MPSAPLRENERAIGYSISDNGRIRFDSCLSPMSNKGTAFGDILGNRVCMLVDPCFSCRLPSQNWRLAGDSPAALPEAASFRVATPRSAGVDCLLPGAPVPYFLILDDSLRQHTSSSLRPTLWCLVNIPRPL